MTPGARVAEVAARILRAETFTLIVSPAVADLQIEAPTAGWPRRLRGYAAVGRAFCGALWYDVVDEVSASLFDETRRATLRAGVSTLAWLTLVQASYYACLIVFMADLGTGARRLDRSALLRDPTFQTIATAALAVVLMTVLLYLVTAAACAWPARRVKPLE